MVISIVRFMSDYYGIPLDAGYRYSHKKIKKTFKQLRRCSFKHADANPELVGSGKIIYVRDGYGEVFPYVCPKEALISDKKCDFTFDDSSKTKGDILEELSQMPTYLVRELLSKYKGKPSFYRVIKAELIERGVYADKKFKGLRENSSLDAMDDKTRKRGKIRSKNRGRWN